MVKKNSYKVKKSSHKKEKIKEIEIRATKAIQEAEEIVNTTDEAKEKLSRLFFL